MILYGAKGGSSASDLYTLSTTTGVATSVGPTGRALTGLAFDPTSGILYGSTSNQSPLNARALVTVDPTTGATTLVGAYGIGSDTLADIAFDSLGNLFGFSASGHKLYSVNKSTGVATVISAASFPGGGFGWAMDFDSYDNLFVLPFGDQVGPSQGAVYLTDQSTGTSAFFADISGSPPYNNGASFAAGAFAPGKIFYAIDNDFGSSAHLVSVNIGDGAVTDIGVTTTGMDALASDTRPTEAWIYRFSAPSIINGASATASVVSGRVRESDDTYWDRSLPPNIVRQKTLKFSWPEAAGRFKVSVSGKPSATRSSGSVRAVICVDGRPYFKPKSGTPSGANPVTWMNYNGLDDGTLNAYDDADYGEGPWVVIGGGQTVEVMIVSDMEDNVGAFVPFDVSSVSFIPDGASAACTGSIAFEGDPLGDVWGSPNGWGGQMLVPDEIWAATGITPYDEGNFPWGVNYTDYDFCVTTDDVVYVVNNDAYNVGSGPNGQSDKNFLVVKKYDPGTGLWTQVQTLNVNPLTDQKGVDGVACEFGPDGFVYIVWWEVDTFTSGTPSSYLWKWHLVKLDPSDDSYVELGTGQHSQGVTLSSGQRSNHDMLGQHGTTTAPSIAFSGGDIYVAAEEVQDAAFGPFDQFRLRAFVWRWNGSTWTDLAIPDPSDVGASPNLYDVIGENGFYDVQMVIIGANADGPKNDGVTVCYCYRRPVPSANPKIILATFEYTVGSGWTEVVLTDIGNVEGDARTNGVAPSSVPWNRTTLDMNLLWSDKLGKLILTADIGGISDEIWDMFYFGATDWQYLESQGPANMAGLWRQGRNTAAIGPDGDIYRGIWTDIVGLDFLPHVIKHSPGFGSQYAVATKTDIGEADAIDALAQTWIGTYVQQFSTTHLRIRWNGSKCYMMGNFFAEPVNAGALGNPYGEGFWVVKGAYVPCGGNVSFSHLIGVDHHTVAARG